MLRFAPGFWRRLRLLVALMALAAFILLLPARFTAPGRVVFNEAVGPLETAAYQGGGDILATTGALTDMFLGEDRERALARRVRSLDNETAFLKEQVRRQGLALRSMAKLQVERFPFRVVRAPLSGYDASGSRRSVSVRAGSRDGVAAGMAVAAEGALVGIVRG
ncbi:MAG: hypothetical protein J7M08_02150, partial [Planctomycetes bacterium]|nr:hypothetical protein [Planctomycetota bacterium]